MIEDRKTQTKHRIATYKSVILARSEYFRALLSASFGGTERKEITINSNSEDEADAVDFETFLGVLEFIFTGTLVRFQAQFREADTKRTQPKPAPPAAQSLPPQSPPAPIISSTDRLASWWKRLWQQQPEKKGEPSPSTSSAGEEEEAKREEKEAEEQQEDFVGGVVRLLSASARYALFDLRTACEAILVMELERLQRLYDRTKGREGTKARQAAVSPLSSEGAIELVLPLLIVADTFGCDRLRSTCLNAACLHADLIRRRIKEHRSDIDTKLMADLSFWLTAALIN